VLTESHAKKVEPEAKQLYSCVSCERIPELAEVNGFFSEDEVVKFKLKHKGSGVEWGKEIVLCKQCETYMNMLGVERSVLQVFPIIFIATILLIKCNHMRNHYLFESFPVKVFPIIFIVTILPIKCNHMRYHYLFESFP